MSVRRSRPGGRSRRRVAAARRQAFTLIELLVVIAVITLLAALTMPVLMSALGAADRTKCGSNLHQIGQAFSMYTANNDLFLPNTPGNTTITVGGGAGTKSGYTTSDRPLNKYCGEENYELFHCPADGGCQDEIFFNLPSFWYGYGNSYVYPTWDWVLGDPGNRRAGRKITYFQRTASITWLMGDGCVYAWGVNLEAAGISPYAAFGQWHDPTVKCNILFMDLHVKYMEMRRAESWPGFSWR